MKRPRGTLGGCCSVLVLGLVAGSGGCTDSRAAQATHDGASDWVAHRCSHESAAAGPDGAAGERPIYWPISTGSRCRCQCRNDEEVCCSQHECLSGQPDRCKSEGANAAEC